MFAWVVLVWKWVAAVLIDTYIHRVLVIDGYLYSRVCGSTHFNANNMTLGSSLVPKTSHNDKAIDQKADYGGQG